MATNETKNSAVTATNEGKNTVSYNRHYKAGQSQHYDSHISYDAEEDPISGNKVTYDGIGTATSVTNENKS
jgi:hypothetical protein